MIEARRSAYRFWFGLFGAHSDPKARLVCIGAALLYLTFPLFDLANDRLGGGSAAVAAVGLATFAAVYLRLFWILPAVADERRAEGWALLGAAAVLSTALAIAFDWLGLLVYLAVVTAFALPTRFAVPGVTAVAAGALAIEGGLGNVAVQALSFGLLLVAVRRLMELVHELDAARGQVAALAVSEERVRLSRDLHDLLGRNLSVITLKSELARKLLERDPAAAEREVRDIEAVARTSLQEARAAVLGLRSASLATELDRAREALEAAGIDVTVRIDGRLPVDIEAALAFTVREATTNVIRHSRARRCEVAVRRTADAAEVEVRDDGVGPPASPAECSGLRGLRERLAQASGALDAGPTPSGGFRVVARVPLAHRQTGVARSEVAAPA